MVSPMLRYRVRLLLPRIVRRIDIFHAQRSYRRNLRDVFAGLRPVEMRRVAGQNDDGSRWTRLQFVGFELVAQSDVKDAGDNGVHPIFRMPMRHELHSARHFDASDVGPRFGGMAYDHCKASRWRKRGERLPVDVFGQNCFESRFAGCFSGIFLLRARRGIGHQLRHGFSPLKILSGIDLRSTTWPLSHRRSAKTIGRWYRYRYWYRRGSIRNK